MVDEIRFMPGYSDKQVAAIELWMEGVDSEYSYPSTVQFTIEESARYAELLTDIETYVEENTLSFITNQLSPETNWDDFVSNIEALGVDELTEMCQTAYDRYIEIGNGG